MKLQRTALAVVLASILALSAQSQIHRVTGEHGDGIGRMMRGAGDESPPRAPIAGAERVVRQLPTRERAGAYGPADAEELGAALPLDHSATAALFAGRDLEHSAAGTGWRSNLPVAGSLSSLVAAVPRVERSVADPVGSTPDSEVICKTTGRETLRNARELTAGVGHDSMAVCLITGRETLRRMRASSEELAVLPPVDPSECRATVYGSGSGISDLGILTALITGRETTRPALGLYRT